MTITTTELTGSGAAPDAAPSPTVRRRGGGGGLGTYLMIRALLIIPTIFILVTTVFFLMRSTGDPITAALGGRLPAAQLAEQQPVRVRLDRREWEPREIAIGHLGLDRDVAGQPAEPGAQDDGRLRTERGASAHDLRGRFDPLAQAADGGHLPLRGRSPARHVWFIVVTARVRRTGSCPGVP